MEIGSLIEIVASTENLFSTCLNLNFKGGSTSHVGSFGGVDQVDNQQGDVTERGVVLLLQAAEDHSCGAAIGPIPAGTSKY